MKLYKILFLSLLVITSTFAQSGHNQKKEQLKALKVAFITDELKLTSEEAAKFWPIYNNFDEKQRELRQEKMRSYMDRIDNGEIDKMTDKEATVFLTQMENTEDELYQLRKKYIASLKTVLSPVKIIKLKSAEENFNRKLLKQYRGKGPR